VLVCVSISACVFLSVGVFVVEVFVCFLGCLFVCVLFSKFSLCC